MDSEAHENEARVQKDIVDACVSHYEVFNVANAALKQAGTVGGDKALSIDFRLGNSLASLDMLSKKMLSNASEWRSKRLVATTAVSQSYRVVELLEAPQTLEACLVSEAYHEALLVVDHVRSIQEEFPQSGLLSAVVERVDQVLGESVTSLVFPKLSQPISLTTCIKLINFLKRLDIPNEDIRVLFLARKLMVLETTLSETFRANQSPYSSLSKAMSVLKINLTEIVLRYEACFDLNDNAHVSELQKWLHDRFSSFSKLFSKHIHLISSGAEIASLANQIDHLSQSLSRVSADVTSILVPLLVQRVTDIFKLQLRLTKETYLAAMGTQMWTQVSSSHQKSTSDAGVPMQLLHYLPLAYVLNGVLTACNEIRKCSFPCIAFDCEEAIDLLLHSVAVDVERLLQSRFLSENERGCVSDFQHLFVSLLVPHVALCLRKLFPDVSEKPFSRTARIFPL